MGDAVIYRLALESVNVGVVYPQHRLWPVTLKKNCVLQKEVNEMKHWSMEKEFIIQKYKSILTQFCK